MAENADLILSADFGTSAVKAGLFDNDLNLVASHTEAYPLSLPGPGMAEQNPDDWWKSLACATLRLAQAVENVPDRVKAIVFCGQMAGVVCADEDGTPLRPCLIWLDKRSAALTGRLVGGPVSIRGYSPFKMAQWLRLANGAPSLTGMDPPGKMLWIRENESATWNRTHKLLDAKDWLLHRASGRFVTTPDNANLTWMMDSRNGRDQWSDRLGRLVGVPRDMLPDIVDGATIVEGLTPASAEELGLRAGTPVIAGSGDVFASALGSGAVGDGELHISIGTSAWIGGFFPTRRLSVTEGYATISGAVDGRPLLIASQETAGACFNWMKSIVTEEDADSAADSLGGLIDQAYLATPSHTPLFLPWMSGERVPADEARLRGAFLGLSLRDTKLTLMRSVLEGVALNTRWAFRSVYRQPGVATGRPVSLIGGVFANRNWCKLLADCLQHPVSVQSEPNMAGVRGGAMIAASSLGWVDKPWTAAATYRNRNARTYEPDGSRAGYFDDRFTEFTYAYRRTLPWFRRFIPSGHHHAGTSDEAASST